MVTEAPPEILVIDDEHEVCDVLRETLERADFNCTMAHHPESIGSLLQNKKFDVIVSDISLPGMTGLDLLQVVNDISPTSRTILITGHRRIEWIQQALRCGAFDYLEKPLDLESFTQTVRRAVDFRHTCGCNVNPRHLLNRHCLMLLDDKGIIRFVSENFALITGVNPAAGLDRDFNQLLAPAKVTLKDLLNQSGVSKKVVINLVRSSSFPYEAVICPGFLVRVL